MKEKFGKRATDSPFERAFYSRDLAPVPAFLVDPFFTTLPDLVIRPANTEEVSTILKEAYAHEIPVTPRAGASTPYFGSVPTKGGIVVDLNLLNGVVALSEPDRTVTVRTGTTWSDLEDFLNPRGFSSKSIPSSAPVATVGGWFCMEGYGIGSLKYGSLVSQVRAVEVVLPGGRVRRLSRESDPPLEWFFASEGTLGIVTELELEIRKLNPMEHFLLHFSGAPAMARIIGDMKEGPVLPYNLHFTDPACLRSLQELGFLPRELETGCLLAIDYEGTTEELNRGTEWMTSSVRREPEAVLLSEEMADSEWSEKFNALRLKRGGPSILGGEIWLPAEALVAYLDDIETLSAKHHLGAMTYGHAATPREFVLMTMFYVDEARTFDYILNLGAVKKIHDVGKRHGGHPYGVGLWNTPYLGDIFSPRVLTDLRERKRKLDPKGLMNPGKVYRCPWVLNPYLFGPAMNVAAALAWFTRKGGRA